MTAPNHGGYRCLCPACGSHMRIRGSEVQTPTYKTMYAQCTNMGCGATFSGSLSWDYCLSPSGMDAPRVSLPLAPAVQRMKALREDARRGNQDQLEIFEEEQTA